MNTQYDFFPGRELIVVGAGGKLDFAATKAAVVKLAADPRYRSSYKLLISLRHVLCGLSELDVYEIASFLGWPDPALPTRRKIAILVSGQKSFNHANFLTLCARNRALTMRAFDNRVAAERWLDSDVANDPLSSAA